MRLTHFIPAAAVTLILLGAGSSGQEKLNLPPRPLEPAATAPRPAPTESQLRRAELWELRLLQGGRFGQLAVLPSLVLKERQRQVGERFYITDEVRGAKWVERQLNLPAGVRPTRDGLAKDAYKLARDGAFVVLEEELKKRGKPLPPKAKFLFKVGEFVAKNLPWERWEHGREDAAAARLPVVSGRRGATVADHLRLPRVDVRGYLAELVHKADNDEALRAKLIAAFEMPAPVGDDRIGEELARRKKPPEGGAKGRGAALEPAARDLIVKHTAALRQFQKEMRELNERLKEVQARRPPDAAAARKYAGDESAFRRRQEDLIDKAQFVTGLTTSLLRNLGGDAAKVGRGLDIVAGSAFKVWGAVAKFGASSPVVPLAVLSALSDLAGLFGLGGPDVNQIILEQVRELRKDVAALRREVAVEFAYLRKDLYDLTNLVLDRLDALEWNLQREVAENRRLIRDAAARAVVKEVEDRKNVELILGRLTELFQKDIVLRADEYEAAADRLEGLTAASPAEARDAYDRYLSNFYSFGVRFAANHTLSGGDARVAGVYRVSEPILHPEESARLIGIAESPAAPWQLINDFAKLAASAGTSLSPDEPALPGASRVLDWDRRALVNPIAWRFSAGRFADLAVRSPEYFRTAANGLHARRLAEVYLRGEDLNDALRRLTRQADGRVNRAVFERLVAMQASAVEKFDAGLQLHAAALEARFKEPGSEGLNLWEAGGPKARPGIIADKVKNLPSDRLLKERYDKKEPGALHIPPDRLAFSPEEAARLERLVPEAYRMAAQIGIGSIEFSYDDGGFVDVRQEYVGRVPYIGGKQMYGRPSLIVRAVYVPTKPAGARVVIFNRRVTSAQEIHFTFVRSRLEYYDPANEEHKRLRPVYYDLYAAPNPLLYEKFWSYSDRPLPGYKLVKAPFVEVFKPKEQGGEDFVTHHWTPLYKPMKEKYPEFADDSLWPCLVMERWGELKAALLEGRGADVSFDRQDPAENERRVRERLDARFTRALVGVQLDAQDDVAKGLGDLGESVRQLYGTQLLTLRFVQLAMPEALADEKMMALMAGDEAALSWQLLAEAVAADPSKKDKWLLQLGGVGKDGKPGPRAPLAEKMRARTLNLQTHLDRAITRQAARGVTYRHPAVEETLFRLVLAAERLGVDLEKELKEFGVISQPHWAVRELKSARERVRKEVLP